MPQPPGALRLQAGLLVVFLYVLQTGLWGLVFHAFPVAPFAVHPGVTSVECMLTLIAGGVAIVWLARRRPGKPFLLRKSAVIAGVAGALATFMLTVLASWGTHQERHQVARSTLQYYSSELMLQLHASAGLLGRLATRWASLDFKVPDELVTTEIQSYFNDIPALQALTVLRDGMPALQQHGRTSQALERLLMSVRTTDVEPSDERARWTFPDRDYPLSGMVLVRPLHTADVTVAAVFDVATLLDLNMPALYHDFRVRLEGPVSYISPVAGGRHLVEDEVYEQVLVPVPGGPGLVLSALAGPAPLLSLQGMLPPVLVVFGLLMTYLLVIGRSLFEIQRDQALEISQRQESQRILQRSLETSDNGVVVVDVLRRDMPVVFANPAFARMAGYSRADVIGKPIRQLTRPGAEPGGMADLRHAVRDGRSTSTTLKIYRTDDTPVWNHVALAPVRDKGERVTHFTAIMTDVTEKKEQERRLAYQARHDVLTGLGNRQMFEERLAQQVAAAANRDGKLAVLFIDLDEFKPINDTLGHKVGDRLLISIARRLMQIVRPQDTLPRFGSDEFILLLTELDDAEQAVDIANCTLNKIADPHQVGAHELYISASIGISLLNDQVQGPEKLIQQADMAMYKAKQQGRDTYQVYSDDLDENLSRRVVLRNELQEALNTGQLFLMYQPQVNAEGHFCGLEALVRWQHPCKGLIPPSDFIALAEETGQIAHLGKWITTQACTDASKLLSMGLLKGRMAVNLSPLQFHRPGFLSTLRLILEETGLDPHYLELELTEGILMRDSQGAIEILNALSEMGIATDIDDFGTGFSSFSYLKDLPVDKIKIDRSFVDNVTTNAKDAAVCKGVITLAREMGLSVVAEGVETLEQFCYLKQHGCKIFQGYYFARPMRLDDLRQWIEKAV